jgi:hypothetical protein
MPFAILWTLLSPLLIKALQVLLPWLIDKITNDIRNGKRTIVTEADIRYQMHQRKDLIRAAYKGQNYGD